ncbi:MAG: hypothetical protein FJW99_00125 [Actinobacteria bacterium]|nr:hypothetical protein [Actinomycetota bacterium]MBM3697669.1 hypothetical protein [Actinomycetota bacterium]
MSGDLDTARMEGEMMAAREAAVGVAGVPMLGLRAVQPGTGARAWLVALEGPAFLCLDDALDPEPSLARFRDVVQAGLAAELADDAVSADALRAFRAPADAMATWGGDLPAAVEALGRAADAADELAAWREDPRRIIASLVDVDEAAAVQQRAHAAYATFAGLTEPLVERQDSLDPALLQALVDVERAADAAGLGASLGKMLAEAMPGIIEAADEMARAHVTPLS